MSEHSLPAPDDQHKPDTLIIKMLPCDVERFGYEEFRLPLGDRYTVAYEGVAPEPKAPSKPRRRREPAADPSTSSPIEHTLYSLQAFGFTHPSHGRYLMVPKELQAIMIGSNRTKVRKVS